MRLETRSTGSNLWTRCSVVGDAHSWPACGGEMFG